MDRVCPLFFQHADLICSVLQCEKLLHQWRIFLRRITAILEECYLYARSLVPLWPFNGVFPWHCGPKTSLRQCSRLLESPFVVAQFIAFLMLCESTSCFAFHQVSLASSCVFVYHDILQLVIEDGQVLPLKAEYFSFNCSSSPRIWSLRLKSGGLSVSWDLQMVTVASTHVPCSSAYPLEVTNSMVRHRHLAIV